MMVVIQIGKRKSMGTFKRRLLDLLDKSGVVIFKSISYNSTEDRLSCGEYELTERDKVLIVIDSDKPIPLGKIITNKIKGGNLRILNWPLVTSLSKAEQQYMLKDYGIRTPEFCVGTQKMEIPRVSVLKPLRGEKGKGVALGIDKARYYQDWVRPPGIGTVFDLRYYVFMGWIFGSALRIAKPDSVSKKDKSLWGTSNTENGARIHFPLGDTDKMKNICKWSEKPYNRIMKWLARKSDMEGIMKDACLVMKNFGLVYGAVDFVFDKKGNHYAIDINPNAAQGKKKINLGRLRRAKQILMQSGFADLPENYIFNLE